MAATCSRRQGQLSPVPVCWGKQTTTTTNRAIVGEEPLCPRTQGSRTALKRGIEERCLQPGGSREPRVQVRGRHRVSACLKESGQEPPIVAFVFQISSHPNPHPPRKKGES